MAKRKPVKRAAYGMSNVEKEEERILGILSAPDLRWKDTYSQHLGGVPQRSDEAAIWKDTYFQQLGENPQRLVAAVEQAKVPPDPLDEHYLPWCRNFVQALGADKHRTALNAVRQLLANEVGLSYVVRHVYDFVAWDRFAEHKHKLMRDAAVARNKSIRRLNTIESKFIQLLEVISHEINLAIYDLPPMAEEYNLTKSDLLTLEKSGLRALQEAYQFENSRVRLDSDKKFTGIMLALRLNFVISALPQDRRQRWWPELAAIMTAAGETMRTMASERLNLNITPAERMIFGEADQYSHYHPGPLKEMASDISRRDMDQLTGTLRMTQPDFFTRAASRPMEETLKEIREALAFRPTPESGQVIKLARTFGKRRRNS